MGLISVPGVSDGTVIDAADVNIPINTIVNEINGKLDTNNFANSAVTTSDISDSAVTYVKLSSDITNLFNAFRVYATYLASPLTFGINPAWTFYNIPDTEITITPTINSSVILDGYIVINRTVNGSSEQDTYITVSVNGGSFIDIPSAGGKGGPGVDDIAAPATLNYTKNIVKASMDLTAGSTYKFRISQGAGAVANVTVYGRYLRALTIPRL